MKPQNPKRTIASMDVLDDIRGLLSASEQKSPKNLPEKSKNVASDAVVSNLQAEIKKYQAQLKVREEENSRLKNELAELAGRLESAAKVNKSKPAAVFAIPDEVAQLETRIAELTQTMAQIEDLLKLKSQELLKKIARIFQESGQDEAALDFRRGASQLEASENFARFLRLLMS